jgi:proteic killer suppression protein
MITGFKSKALKLYWWKGSPRKLPADQLARIRVILDYLELAEQPEEMDYSGLHLHELKGRDNGRWSVRVTANWRITFAFEETDAVDVDYEDYH